MDIGGSGERYVALDAERLQIEVGPEEAIEQNDPVSAVRFELSGEIASGAEERRELDRNRDVHLGLDMTDDVEVAALDVLPLMAGSVGSR